MTATGPASRRRPRPVLVAALWWLVVLVLLAGIGGLLAVGANGPADPRLASPGASSSPGVQAGAVEFGEVAFRVTPPPAPGFQAPAEYCALLAETEQQHQRGLMGRRGLGGYDAMVFTFAEDRTGPFYMRNVPIPLSIAWFDAGGRLVSTADMEPCPDQDGCTQYPPGGPYRYAVEVEKGGLSRLGIAPGSVLSVGGSCSR